ncbi:MAG: hypothetical protein ACRBI6_12375 [Acidimicrobiales bacterium]
MIDGTNGYGIAALQAPWANAVGGPGQETVSEQLASGARPADLEGAVSGVLSSAPSEAQEMGLGQVADVLDTDSGTLLKELRSGANLSAIMAEAGVPASALVGALERGLLVDYSA